MSRHRLLAGSALLSLTGACQVEPMVLVPCAASEEKSDACWAARREEPIADAQGDAVTRFFAVGDMGKRDPAGTGLAEGASYVASLVKAVCAARGGCDFGLMLGDNVYERGIEGDVEARFFEELSRQYSNDWTVPLVYTLGNHDYDPYLAKTGRARAELELITRLYDAHAGKVRGRSHFFDLSAGNVDVFAWDTNYLVHACEPAVGEDPACARDAGATLSAVTASEAPFKIWIGHHPFYSNGEHGDAGEFEECLAPWACVGLWSGTALRQLARRYVLGHADLMLSGHDHTLQAFSAPELRGTALVVSGAGAKMNALGRAERRRSAWFEAGGVLGFTLVEATSDELTVTLFGAPVGPGTLPAKVDEGTEPPAPLFVMSKSKGGAWTRARVSGSAGG